jgi:anthranilate phosphoribosyltransferase
MWPEILDALTARRDLTPAQAEDAMRAIMGGEATPAQIAAFLIGLRAKGETVEEIAAGAKIMREVSLHVSVDVPVIDTCGTGGDRSGSVNVSTMAALVAAGAGVAVAKHGNRSATSKCGSADLLEALGVAIDIAPEGVARCIEEAGIGFCFAPRFHPAMRFAGPVRRELGVPTVFNLLGPLTNPAGARRQVIGVASPAVGPKLAAALQLLGAESAWVVHGDDGLDEITTTTTTTVWDGSSEERVIDPLAYGIARATPADLAGGEPATNAEVCVAVLGGEEGPVADAVALNAAAALVVAGAAPDLAAGLDAARESLASGRAATALERLREVSNAS